MLPLDISMDFDTALRFLSDRGADEPEHNSAASLLEHIVGTYDVVRAWNAERPAMSAALFHSVYGTQNFRTAVVGPAERDAVRAVIGERAERLAFLFCSIDFRSLYDAAERSAVERFATATLTDWRGGPAHEVSLDEVAVLVNLALANAVEQLPRDDRTMRRDLPQIRRAWHLVWPAAKDDPRVRALAALA